MLRYKADIRSLCFVSLYFCLFFYTWFFVPKQWIPMTIAVFILCNINFMVGVIVHNAVHSPVFKNKTVNRAFQVILSLAFGGQVSAYVPGHNLSHHKHLQTAKDNTRTLKLRYRWNFLNQFLCLFVMIPGLLRTEASFAKRLSTIKPRWYLQYKIEFIAVWIWRIVWCVIDWRLFLVVMMLPNVFCLWGIFGSNYWQHDGCDENHPYNHSRNFTGWSINFLMCNNGYHGAHHMKPGLHWSLYPDYYKKEIAPYIHPALNQKYLIPYLWKTCIYPAKRIDYLGNALNLPADVKDEDWIEETVGEKLDVQELAAVTT